MKTLDELYAEVMNSEELKNEFLTLKAPEDIVAFAAKNGCTATLDEIKAFFEEKAKAAGELSEDDLAQVAGGKGFNISEALWSTFTAGILCAINVLQSVSGGKVGTAIEGDYMLCTYTDRDGKERGPLDWDD